MSKEKFNWKSLFVKTDEETTPENETSSPVSFPKSEGVAQNVTLSGKVVDIDQTLLSSVLSMYEKGFESLNIPGYDFFEFYKSIMAVGPDNPSAYEMAFTMAKSMDKNLTKESLLTNAIYYLGEIDSVHKKYQTEGVGKKSEITALLRKEKENLTNDINELSRKILLLQKELEEKSGKHRNIDASYNSQILEIDRKLVANDFSKERIVDSINTVVKGINTHIKK